MNIDLEAKEIKHDMKEISQVNFKD